MITTTELLDFLTKAQRVSTVGATFRQTDEGYTIALCCDWYGDANYGEIAFSRTLLEQIGVEFEYPVMEEE